jgi:D-apiose dehydrogenase
MAPSLSQARLLRSFQGSTNNMQPASAKIRVALVGTGYYSQFHIDGWQKHPEAQLCAVCDLDQSRAATTAREHAIAASYTDVARMLLEVKPDVIDIVTPPATHASVVEQAIGKVPYAVCQKPLTGIYAQALALTQKAETHHTTLLVHENFRFTPWFREVKRLIDSGHFGRLYGVTFRLRPGDGQGLSAYLDRQPHFQKMPRLLVAETAIHLIDAFRFLAGEVKGVYAQLRRLNPAIAGEDAGIIVFEFDSGAAGIFDGNRLNEHPAANQRRTMGELWVEGERGVLRLDGEARLWFKPHGQPEQEHVYDQGRTDSFGGGASQALQAHVIDGIKRGTPLQNLARNYLENIRIQEAVYRSHETGCRIDLASFQTGDA